MRMIWARNQHFGDSCINKFTFKDTMVGDEKDKLQNLTIVISSSYMHDAITVQKDLHLYEACIPIRAD